MAEHLRRKCPFVLVIAGVYGLVLMLLFSACSLGGGSVATEPTPTPVPTPTPLPSPTPTPVPTAGAALIVYKGDGYTISYPQGWKVTMGTDNIVSFSDQNGIAYMAITSQPNPQGVVSPSHLVDAGLQVFKTQVKNYQQVDVAPTTSFAGETWNQGSAAGDITPEGQTSTVPAKVIVLATNHPVASSSTRGYTIAYGTGQQIFDLTDHAYFQPMLNSFLFT